MPLLLKEMLTEPGYLDCLAWPVRLVPEGKRRPRFSRSDHSPTGAAIGGKLAKQHGPVRCIKKEGKKEKENTHTGLR